MPSDVNLHDLEPWLVEACASAGVPREQLDVGLALRLSREVAHRFERPMAPVSTCLLGLAIAQHPDADPRELFARIEATLPASDAAQATSTPTTTTQAATTQEH